MNRDSELAGIGVAFCGSNVRVSSVVLDAHVKKPADISKCLQRLKASNVPLKKSVAFMFACIGRGRHFYKGKENVESSEFRKLFPTTPLFGFFGNGEIGFEHVPDHAAERPRRENVAGSAGGDSPNVAPSGSDDASPPMDIPNVIYHSYTTIFVLMSFA